MICHIQLTPLKKSIGKLKDKQTHRQTNKTKTKHRKKQTRQEKSKTDEETHRCGRRGGG